MPPCTLPLRRKNRNTISLANLRLRLLLLFLLLLLLLLLRSGPPLEEAPMIEAHRFTPPSSSDMLTCLANAIHAVEWMGGACFAYRSWVVVHIHTYILQGSMTGDPKVTRNCTAMAPEGTLTTLRPTIECS